MSLQGRMQNFPQKWSRLSPPPGIPAVQQGNEHGRRQNQRGNAVQTQIVCGRRLRSTSGAAAGEIARRGLSARRAIRCVFLRLLRPIDGDLILRAELRRTEVCRSSGASSSAAFPGVSCARKPPPVFIYPITLRSSAEASTSASLVRCALSVDGIVPSSWPSMDSPRSFTT